MLTNEREQTYNLSLIDSENGSILEQLTHNNSLLNGFYGLMWTSNGKQIIYAETDSIANGNIWKYNIETKQTKQLTFDRKIQNWWAVISPNNQKIYYTSNRNGSRHIWEMNIDGSNQKQFTKGKGELHTQISPDGRWLIYVSEDFLWRQSIENGERIKIMKKEQDHLTFPLILNKSYFIILMIMKKKKILGKSG